MPQAVTTAEDQLIRTAPRLKPATRIELVSRTNPNDVRLVIDTRDRQYDPERTGILPGGGITADVNRQALRTVQLNIQDWTGAWLPGPGRALWLDAMLRVYRGYTNTQLWPQGVYVIADPQHNDQGQITIAGTDKTATANGQDEGGFLNVLKLPKGLSVTVGIETLAGLPTWGETSLNLWPDATAVLPYEETCQLTDYPWQKAHALARIPGNYRDLHFDQAGYLTWAPDPDPNLLQPCYEIWPEGDRPGTALPGEFAAYISASRQIETRGLRNWVEVVGGSGKAAPVRASAADTAPNSPLSTSRIGYRIHHWNGGRPDRLITTVAEAQARADYELRRLKQWSERIPLTITELPWLLPWDVLRIRNTSGMVQINDTYQVVSYTLPLDASGVMQLQGWRVRKGAT